MTCVVELDALLNTLSPKLQDGEFVFCAIPGAISAYGHLEPLAAIPLWQEKCTLVIIPGIQSNTSTPGFFVITAGTDNGH